MESVFHFRSYKSFLSTYFTHHSKDWGIKTKLCKAIGIHNAYLSQVLHQEKHLTPEQLLRLADFLTLSPSAKDYFIYLGLRERAGTEDLARHFDAKLDDLREKNLNLVQRLGRMEDISDENKQIYYSSWVYPAIHVAVHVPSFQEMGTLAEKFGLSEKKIQEALEFLRTIGLVQQKDKKYLPTEKWIRISKSSPWITQHHSNIRLRALERMRDESPDSVHYSGFFSFSKEDFHRIKEMWLSNIEKSQKIIKESPAEEVYCLGLDIFQLSENETASKK